MEDEWEREIESEEDLDLLFVSYRPSQVSLDKLRALIESHGFKAEVKHGAEHE